MNNEIKVNKSNKSIMFINNGIAFEQFGVADEILDLITNLQQKVEQYENPDDLTLFYMWLDEKAKDKMKQLENEVMMLKQQNTMITTLGEDYKSRCEKATEYINESIKHPTYAENIVADCDGGKVENLDKLLNILNGDDKSAYR